MADINFVANPLVNIHLQGALRYLSQASRYHPGEEMLGKHQRLLQHDDVFDPRYPMGTGQHVCQVLHGTACLPDHGLSRSTTVSS